MQQTRISYAAPPGTKSLDLRTKEAELHMYEGKLRIAYVWSELHMICAQVRYSGMMTPTGTGS